MEVTKIDLKAVKLQVDNSIRTSLYFFRDTGLIPLAKLTYGAIEYKIIRHNHPKAGVQYCAYRREDWEKVLPYLTYLETDARCHMHTSEALNKKLITLNKKWYVKLGKKIEDIIRKLKCFNRKQDIKEIANNKVVYRR